MRAGECQGTCTERGTGTVVPWTLALALALALGVGVHYAGPRSPVTVWMRVRVLYVVCKDKDKGLRALVWRAWVLGIGHWVGRGVRSCTRRQKAG